VSPGEQNFPSQRLRIGFTTQIPAKEPDMSLYESEALCRAIIAERIREADHRRLVREVRQSEVRTDISTATTTTTASADRRSRLWKLVHLSHAYG
jgi:hypothetical protein